MAKKTRSGKRGVASKKASKKSASAKKKPSRVKGRSTAKPRASVKKKKPTTKKPAAKKRVASKKPASPRKKPAEPTVRKREPAATPEVEMKRLQREMVKLANRLATLTTRQIEKSSDPHRSLFDPRGDDDLWQSLESANSGPLPQSAVRSLIRGVLSAARREVKTQRVAYLGPPYSFTHLAAMERFGDGPDLCPVNTIATVFEEVNRGHANYGIVPIENSTDGRVVDTLDMFTRLPLRICGEVQISVHHNLLARCSRGEITEIYSKPQALSQCRDWLARSMPQSRLIEVTSTSTAAQLARDKHGAAAVASRQAAIEYDLQIVADNIEDNANNVTRFAIIGDEVSKASGKDRTALLLQIPHKPGSLTDALSAFKKNKINLTWIESFPLRGPESGYLFFIDFEGHVTDAGTKRTLEELKELAVRLEVLGSYPRSEIYS